MLRELYKELNKLYKGIEKFCEICKKEDCKGYVWLLSEEAEILTKKNISLLEINRIVHFIDSFPRQNGLINVEKKKPSCILRKQNGKCTIYSSRPLACRLYPLDFKIFKKNLYVVLHPDCIFVEELIKNNKISQFLERVIFMFSNCNQRLLKKILKKYRLVSSISKYPKNYKHNDYIKILKVVNLKNKNEDMSKCKAVLDSQKIKELRIKAKAKKKK